MAMLIDRTANKKPSRGTYLRLLWTSLIYQTKEFFNNSTLHGVRYIAEEGRPFGERFMWFCFTTSGAVAAFIIIVNLWDKFQTNPTITGLDTDFHNQQLIFPTINVCPVAPFEENRTRNMAYATLGNYDDDTADKLEPMLILLTRLSYGLFDEISTARGKLSITEQKIFAKRSLRSLAFLVAKSCPEVLDKCKYKDETFDCCEFFFPVYTEHGFCYAFNNRFIDTAIDEKKNDNIKDLFETDKKWALNFQPRSTSRIFVHSHLERFGWDFRPQIEWSPTSSVELLIAMKETYTTEDARQLSIVQRKCIFDDEIQLEIYDDEKYTFTSCMKECRVKKCLKFCRCVPPFFKPIPPHNYCNLVHFECLARHLQNITDVKDCKQCELSCSNTVYDIEKMSETGGEQDGEAQESSITVEYLTWPIIRYKREVLFGWVDLLVSFGGIAGLFLGFSLLSGVEIVYYFTMRTWCMVYKNRDILYAIQDEQQNKPVSKMPYAKAPPGEQIIMVKSFGDTNDLGTVIPKRLNRANLKLQAARELAKPRFKHIGQVGPVKAFLEPGQFGYVP